MSQMNLSELNNVAKNQFLERIGGPLEGEAWLAERVAALRPFADREALIMAFYETVGKASLEEKISLIASHPDLAGRAAIAGNLSAMSVAEQAAAGLDKLSPEEYAEFGRLNGAYKERFGFPFVICAREHNKTSILAHFGKRLENARESEIETGIGEVLKILSLRLKDMIDG
jgi:OHCU decarboxylase